MEQIRDILQLDYVQATTIFFILLFGLKEAIEIFAYFRKKFRIRTGLDQYKDETQNRLQVLEEHDKWQYDTIQDILAGINDLKKSMIDRIIEDYRFEILDMASSLTSGKRYNKEQYDHAIIIYQKYEDILKENGLENGQVTVSMEIIMESYKEKMKNGF